MRFEQTISTAVDPTRAWTALAEVTAFPAWTRSMTSVEPLDGADLRVGRRYRIRQPGMLALVWRVSQVREGESFVWESRVAGVRTVASHELSADPAGGARITLSIDQSGALAGLIGALTGGRTRRYLRMEADGLKAASESPGGPAGTAGGGA